MPPRVFAGAAVSLVLVGTSCSGDDESADTTTDNTSTGSTTASAATSSTGPTVSTTDAPPSTPSSDYTAAGPTSSTTSTTTDLATTAVPGDATSTTTTPANPPATSAPTTATDAPPASTTTTMPAATGWIAPTGDYTAEFPSEPMAFEQPPLVEATSTPVTLYAVETPEFAVLTSRTDVADEGLDASAIVLESVRDTVVDNAAGDLTSSEDVTFQGRDGVRFRFAVGEPQIGVGDVMLLVDGTVLYQVAGIGVTAEEAFLTAFVDSFAFTEGG